MPWLTPRFSLTAFSPAGSGHHAVRVLPKGRPFTGVFTGCHRVTPPKVGIA